MNTGRKGAIAVTIAAALLGTGLSAPSAHAAPAGVPSIYASAPVIGTSIPPWRTPPTRAARYWFAQPTGDDCAVAATAIIIDTRLHKRVDFAKLTKRAAKVGMYVRGDGSDTSRVPALLADYGLTGTLHSGLTIQALAAELGAGHLAIVDVNAEQIWDREGFTTDTPQATDADHAVIVGGIDFAAQTVTLIDTGMSAPLGASEVTPMSVFVSSWAASGNRATIAR